MEYASSVTNTVSLGCAAKKRAFVRSVAPAARGTRTPETAAISECGRGSRAARKPCTFDETSVGNTNSAKRAMRPSSSANGFAFH